jgi:uncharacterized protein (TIGR02001 family)
MSKRRNALLLLFLSVSAADIASAQDETGWSGAIDLVSEYRFRGISQSNGDPALQAGVEFAAGSGFYAGLWGSNISWLSDGADDVSSSIEIDVYLGWRTEFASGLGLDLGLTQYLYPGDFPSDFNSADTTEAYLALSYAGFSLGYAHSLTDLFGLDDSRDSGYLSLAYEHEFDGGWSIAAGVGRQRIANDSAGSYTDWSASLSKEFAAGFSATVAYIDTNADAAIYTNAYGDRIADSTVVLTLSKGF